MSEECHELQNIKYQTMLLNGNSKSKQIAPEKRDDILKVEQFLEKEQELNIQKPWNKLGKATKLKRIAEFVIDYSSEHNLSTIQSKSLNSYLLKCLERKKLNRQKDVVYDIKLQKIKMIPNLSFHKNKFTLKRHDKKSSSLNLTPHNNKKNKTKSNKKKTKSKKTNKIDTDLKK